MRAAIFSVPFPPNRSLPSSKVSIGAGVGISAFCGSKHGKSLSFRATRKCLPYGNRLPLTSSTLAVKLYEISASLHANEPGPT